MIFPERLLPRLSFLVVTFAALVACTAFLPADPQNTAVAASPDRLNKTGPVTAMVFTPSGHAEMEAWRRNFAARALAAGHDDDAVFMTLEGIHPLPLYLGRNPGTEIASQAEFAQPVWAYVDKMVTGSRKVRGQEMLRTLAPILDRIEAVYAVDREFLIAIWALESDFGAHMGRFDAANILANMATEGRRRLLAEKELVALMTLQERGDVQRGDLVSGWAGAMGHMQFMPSTFLGHAVDFDGDGRKNIWGSVADALASAASYLRASGYRKDQAWGMEVRAPGGFDWSLADGRVQTVSAWIDQHGLSPVTDSGRIMDADVPAALWLPAGASGPKYLLFSNFNVCKTYNGSSSYAFAVGLLADHFTGKNGPVTPWPKHVGLLTVKEVRILQDRLNRLGFDAGTIDGVAGPRTRNALRQFQKTNAIYPADGFPAANTLAPVLDAANRDPN